MSSIRLTTGQHDEIRGHVLADEAEGAAFLTAGYFENRSGAHFTVREVLIPRKEDYDFRSSYHLEMSPAFFNRAIGRAEAEGLTVIQCHSHPFSRGGLRYSVSDYRGEGLSSEAVRGCLGKPMGSLLFGPDGVIGRAWPLEGGDPVGIDELRLVDGRLRIRELGRRRAPRVDREVYDRQIRAFGIRGQAALAGLRAGIVGLGGTGSAVAEQLAREGVGRFVLADHDRFSPSNVTRMYGSYAGTGPEPKVEIAKRNITRIQEGADVRAVPEDVVSQEVLAEFKECDVVFSCTDRHAPRSVLNDLAHQYFIPVIDTGVGIASDGSRITGASVRVSLSSPSTPCLYCADVVRPEEILAESLSPDERERRAEAGYVAGMRDDEPSVVPMTTMAASCAVMALKDLLFGAMGGRTGTVILDAVTLEKIHLASVKEGCVCTAQAGLADSKPMSAPWRGGQ